MVIHGGLSLSTTFSDMWRFDLVGKFWEQLQFAASSPPAPPRASHCGMIMLLESREVFITALGFSSITPIEGNRPLSGGWINGALLGSVKADVWMLDLGTRVWSQLPVFGDLPTPRFGMAFIPLSSNKMIFSGGYSLSHGQYDDVFTGTVVANAPDGASWFWQELDSVITPTSAHVLVFPDRFTSPHPKNSTVRLFTYAGLAPTRDLAVDTVQSVEIGCTAGQFSLDFATSICTPCPPGEYAPQPGMSSCRKCPGQSYR